MVYAFAVERGSLRLHRPGTVPRFPDRSENSLRPRRVELVDAGRLIDNGQRRKNARGSKRTLAKRFGISATTAEHCRKGKTWAHVT
jgi:hypothetical protein